MYTHQYVIDRFEGGHAFAHIIESGFDREFEFDLDTGSNIADFLGECTGTGLDYSVNSIL